MRNFGKNWGILRKFGKILRKFSEIKGEKGRNSGKIGIFEKIGEIEEKLGSSRKFGEFY